VVDDETCFTTRKFRQLPSKMPVMVLDSWHEVSNVPVISSPVADKDMMRSDC